MSNGNDVIGGKNLKKAMPKYKLSEQDKLEIVEKYTNGANIHHLSKQYLIDRSCIRIVLAHAGIVKRVVKPKPIVPRVRKNMRASRPAPLKKGFWLWKEFPKEKAYPKNYDEYLARRGIKKPKIAEGDI